MNVRMYGHLIYILTLQWSRDLYPPKVTRLQDCVHVFVCCYWMKIIGLTCTYICWYIANF